MRKIICRIISLFPFGMQWLLKRGYTRNGKRVLAIAHPDGTYVIALINEVTNELGKMPVNKWLNITRKL